MDEQQKEKESGESSHHEDLGNVLSQALCCLNDMDDDYSDGRRELESISQRLLAGKFRLAVLGQFKRGKSTFLNALLGEELLPTDILPATAIPTFISAAEEIEIQVAFSSEEEIVKFSPSSGQSISDFLTEFVTEKGNPKNQRMVARVDIGHPADILKQGIVLIDTPGIGSTYKHNTEVAYQILPQCDAAIFLVSADPPITEMELDYLKEIKQCLPRTFFLLNKVDYLDDREKTTSLRFLSDQLIPLYDGAPLVLPISAKLGLNARLAAKNDSWKASGMEQVEKNLIDFFAREKQKTLQVSLQRRTSDQLNHINMQLQLSLKALILPEEELKQRIEQFRQSLPDVEREKQAAGDILSGDLKRIVGRLTKEVEAVRTLAKEKIMCQLDNFIQSIEDIEELERLVREMLAQELPTFFAPAMRQVAEVIQAEATELLALHQQRSHRLVEQVRKIAAELFDIPYHAPAVGRSYTKFEVSGWSHELFISDMDPLGQKLSRKFLTQKYRRKRTVNRLREEGLKLLNQNVEQINWALRRGLDENFTQFGGELSEQLERTISATRKAMEIALQKSESTAHETASREIKLKQTQSEIQRILIELG
ncbi:dynamin family protein [uncultured Desulfuromusa sp.]|uniref:dynamin family protein n=1 Tax=uncultured Desulfuromusa sp. TaxID=219183 RepID=UPI002AA6F6B5|nr:dynamin family protein [uncultured Desulfuromusa sp.]